MNSRVILCAPSHPEYRQRRGKRPLMRVTFIGDADRAEWLGRDTCEGRLIVHVDPADCPARPIPGAPLPRGVRGRRTWLPGTGIPPHMRTATAYQEAAE